MRDLLRNGPFFWTFFTHRRVCNALRLVHPDLGVGVEADSDSESDDPTSCDVPAEETNVRSSKGNGIDLGDIDFTVDDSILLGWDSDLAYGDGSGSRAVPIPNFNELFASLPSSFDPPSSVDELGRSKVVAEGSHIQLGAYFPDGWGGFRDPIPVSPNTEEVTTEDAGYDEEVDCPADAFGASMSGGFNFDM
uniref:Uncharacterized protein n=1 Tax=Brassica campestris TaxID=3711 RepID=M4F075_BRACM